MAEQSIPVPLALDCPRPMVSRPGTPYQPPSQGWLNNPAWIDGPNERFYPSHEEIDEEIAEAARHGRFPQIPPPNPVPASPEPPVLPAPQVPAAAGVAVEKETEGTYVTVTALYSLPPQPTAKGRPTTSRKKKAATVLGLIQFTPDITRLHVLTRIFELHQLNHLYRPGDITGPRFKLSFTGSSGGKTNAPSIDNDEHWELVRGALRARLAKSCKTNVEIEIDLDNMEGFRILQPTGHTIFGPMHAMPAELTVGTHVPRVENFSDATQLHGRIIQEIKTVNPCAKHVGEHGEPSYCYVVPKSGDHVRLTNQLLKTWAAAVAAHRATVTTPPATAEFGLDGEDEGFVQRPRGRAKASSLLHAPPPSSAGDAIALLVTAMIPLITDAIASRKRPRTPSPPPSASTSKRTQLPVPIPLPSMIPEEPHLVLRECLRVFFETKEVDLRHCEDALWAAELTPDIIPSVPVLRLCQLTKASEGQIYKFHNWCTEWNALLELQRANRDM